MVGNLDLKYSGKRLGENRMPKTYHIYLDDRCLFKNLDDDEFRVVWGRLYHSYWDGLTYSECEEKKYDLEPSY